MVGIYKITNKQTGDCYIGKSKNIEKRWSQHFDSGYGASHSAMFQEHIDQYGKGGFLFEVLEECDAEQLHELEAKYILKFSPTYNTVCRGRAVPQEVREKISKTLLGRKQPAAEIERRRLAILRRHEVYPQTNSGHKKRVMADVGADNAPPAEFDSVKSAAIYFGVDASTVTKALKRKGKVRGRSVWYAV